MNKRIAIVIGIAIGLAIAWWELFSPQAIADRMQSRITSQIDEHFDVSNYAINKQISKIEAIKDKKERSLEYLALAARISTYGGDIKLVKTLVSAENTDESSLQTEDGKRNAKVNYYNLARHFYELGNAEQARSYINQSIELFNEQQNDLIAREFALKNLETKIGEADLAEALVDVLQDPFNRFLGMSGMLCGYAEEGNLEKALTVEDNMLSFYRQSIHNTNLEVNGLKYYDNVLANSRLCIARAYSRSGDEESSQKYISEVNSNWHLTDYYLNEYHFYSTTGNAEMAQKSLAKAQSFLDELSGNEQELFKKHAKTMGLIL